MDFRYLLKSAGFALLVISSLLALVALAVLIHSGFGLAGSVVYGAVLLFAWTTFCFYVLR